MQNLTKVIEDFHENGIAVVKGFASEAECDAMIAQMRDIVDKTDMKVNSEFHRIFKAHCFIRQLFRFSRHLKGFSLSQAC